MRNRVHSIWIILNLIIILTQSVVCIPEEIPEDAKLNFTQLAIKYGHKCDEHDVVTEDGYILKVFNVRGDKTRPVYLQHGFTDSADTFIIRGLTSLVITLADEGYDVWAGNYRGNKYAQCHQTLDPKTDKLFWDYSQHEMGVYDLPAMIDHVLKKTGQKQLQAIGHSQGTMTFYIMAAEKPEYNDKIKLFISLAPICYIHHMKPLASTAVEIWSLLGPLVESEGILHLFSRHTLFTEFIKALCSLRIGYPICSTAIFSFAGFDITELEHEFLPILVGHYPDTASVKNGNHLIQIAEKKRFCKYDYGLWGNLEIYGTPEPPNYDLGKVVMPVALIASENDYFSSLEDVDLLQNQLSNLVYYHVMERKVHNHIDFVWGRNMTGYLFPIVLRLLEKHG